MDDTAHAGARDESAEFDEKREAFQAGPRADAISTGMAIYHLSAKLISRSKGRSAVAAAAYRHGLRLIDERTGITHDYRRKAGIEHSEIIAPAGAPGWALKRGVLWNTVERGEKRKDAQLAREIEIALPSELSLEWRVALMRQWVKTELADRGMIADLALHAPGADGDSRNYHAHIVVTLRPVTPAGFGPKARAWGNRDMLRQWRRSWADDCNEYLAAAGCSERVDDRSLAVQGIDRQPSIKRGQAASAIDRRTGEPASDRGAINAGIYQQNRQRRRQRLDAVQQAREQWEIAAAFIKTSLLELVEADEVAEQDHDALDQLLDAGLSPGRGHRQ